MWTIKVWATPELAAARERWSERRQAALHEIAADLVHVAIRAVQTRFLRTRRTSVWLAEGEVFYFFRRDRRAPRTILITIFKIDFHAPDCDPPKPGASAPEPPEPLVVDATISKDAFTIDYVEGVLPRPPRKDKGFDIRIIHADNRIVIRAMPNNEYCRILSLRPPMLEDRDSCLPPLQVEIGPRKSLIMKPMQMRNSPNSIIFGGRSRGNSYLSERSSKPSDAITIDASHMSMKEIDYLGPGSVTW